MDGKTFAVVGVAGIAFAVARQLLADCANVALGDLSNLAMATAVVELLDKKERTQELPNSEPDRGVRPQDRIKDCPLGVSNKFQDQMKISSLNVSTRAHVDAWKDAIVRQFGRLDGAVNLAGVTGRHSAIRMLNDQDNDEWDIFMRVNVTGVMYCIRAQINAMAKTSNGGASIVNATSVLGTQGLANSAACCTPKHADFGLRRSVAKEVAKDGIRVNAVALGAIEPPLRDESLGTIGLYSADECSLGRMRTVEEVATVVVFLLSLSASYLTGSVFEVEGGGNCWTGEAAITSRIAL